MNNNVLQLVTFGVSTLLLGSFVGGQFSQWRGQREDIKAIQQKHEDILKQINANIQAAVQQDQHLVNQIDSVYSILDDLTLQEGKARANLTETRKRIDRIKQQNQQTGEQLKDAAKNSKITFD